MAIDIGIKCGSCDADLGDGQVLDGKLYIDPCEKCLSAMKDEGYDEGLADGREENN